MQFLHSSYPAGLGLLNTEPLIIQLSDHALWNPISVWNPRRALSAETMWPSLLLAEHVSSDLTVSDMTQCRSFEWNNIRGQALLLQPEARIKLGDTDAYVHKLAFRV